MKQCGSSGWTGVAVRLSLACLLAGPAVRTVRATVPEMAPPGEMEALYQKILKLREDDLKRSELRERIHELEAERDRLRNEKKFKEEEADRMEAALAELRARAESPSEAGPVLWISMVETTVRREGAAPRTVPALTVVQGVEASLVSAFPILMDGVEYAADPKDFARGNEVLAQLKSNEKKLTDEANSLTASLEKVQGQERADWEAHIERLRKRIAVIRETRAQVEAAFAAARKGGGGEGEKR